MSLTNYRALGRSGLVVSPLCLGAMTFGPGDWGVDEAGARAIFDAYLDAGGNFVDTADSLLSPLERYVLTCISIYSSAVGSITK